MAQTYNLYLRKRLTEFDIIIHNLPYRDGLSAYSTMILKAMANYLTAQKFIVSESDMSLRIEVDTMLERVFEKLHQGLVIGMEGNAFSAKPVVGDSFLQLDTEQTDFSEECFNQFSNVTTLTTNVLEYELAKSIGYASTQMKLKSSEMVAVEQSFASLVDSLIMQGQGSASEVSFASGNDDMSLCSDEIDMYYLIAMQGEAVMNLLCAADFEMWYTLGDAYCGFVLSSVNDDVHSEKFISASNIIEIVQYANESVIGFINHDDLAMSLYSELSIGMKRCSTFDDLDEQLFGDMDDEIFSDLDYIILADETEGG